MPANTRRSSPSAGDSATFVLVHGAWVGGWAWTRVADLLIANGHHVYAPTLSGLGERSHLPSHDINLSTHVSDIVNEIKWKDLDQIVLVGHSYGGLVITGVAEQIGERIASIVYLEAFILENGQSFSDLVPAWSFAGETIPPPSSSEGDYRNDADRTWVNAKATPQPTATLTEKLRVTGAYERIPKKAFIRATGWKSPFDATVTKLRRDPSWQLHELPCGHDVPIDMPVELATILRSCI